MFSSVWAIDVGDCQREFAYLKTVVFLVFTGREMTNVHSN
jgi:hypothetical protein